MVKNLPASEGDASSIPGLGRSLEENMATHSSILALRIPWTEEPGGLQSIGSQRVEQYLAFEHQHIFSLYGTLKKVSTILGPLIVFSFVQLLF